MNNAMNTQTNTPRLPKLYHELTEWYSLLTPVSHYAEEAAFYQQLFETHCHKPPRTLLELGSGAGHNAFYLKKKFDCTLVDLSPEMIKLNQRLNPECVHLQGDMRTVRLLRTFDCVFIHDAICYMTTRNDLESAIRTAFEHTAPGGVALFQPDAVLETFAPDASMGGSDEAEGKRGMRYLQWIHAPNPGEAFYITDMIYVMQNENGAVEVAHDRHVNGLFPKAVWLDVITKAGFQPIITDQDVNSPHPCHTFLGLRKI